MSASNSSIDTKTTPTQAGAKVIKRPAPAILAQQQKVYQKIVLLPATSIGHSRQNSSGSGSAGGMNSSLATFQDSLNSIAINHGTSGGNNPILGQQAKVVSPHQIFIKPFQTGTQPQTAQVSARGDRVNGSFPHLVGHNNSSSTSSTETLLQKPGLPIQARAMVSAQTTIEKVKQSLNHSKRSSTDLTGVNSGSSQSFQQNQVKPQQLYLGNHIPHQAKIHHRANSSSSSSGGSSGGALSSRKSGVILNNPQNHVIHIHNEKKGLPPAPPQNINAHTAGSTQITIQQQKILKYNKMKSDLVHRNSISGGTNQGNIQKKASHEILQKNFSNFSGNIQTPTNIASPDIGPKTMKASSNTNSQTVPSHMRQTTVSQQKQIVLKTSQMTKNLLMNSNHLPSQQATPNQQSHKANINEPLKSSTLKIAVNSILGAQSQSSVNSGGELSARVYPKLNFHSSINKQVPSSRQNAVNIHHSRQSSNLITNDSLKNTPTVLNLHNPTQVQPRQISSSVESAQLNSGGIHQSSTSGFNIPSNIATNGLASKMNSAMTSSKIMMALHKKCNSISTTPMASNLSNPTNNGMHQFFFQPKEILALNNVQAVKSAKNEIKEETTVYSHDTLVEDHEQLSDPPQTVRHNSSKDSSSNPAKLLQINQKHNHNASQASTQYQHTLSTMTTQQLPSDENAHAGSIPQMITPRCVNQNEKPVNNKPGIIMQRHKPSPSLPINIAPNGYIPSSIMMANGPNKENMIHNGRIHHKRNVSITNATEHNQNQLISEHHLQKDKRQTMIFEAKRSVQHNQKSSQNSAEREEVMSTKLAKAHEEFSSRKRMKEVRKDAKEDIVQQIGLLLRNQKKQSIDEKDMLNDPSHQLTLQHLRDFLTYLEDKKIINCETLGQDDKEMKNLINDLVKLDFNKFNCPLGNQNQIPRDPKIEKKERPVGDTAASSKQTSTIKQKRMSYDPMKDENEDKIIISSPILQNIDQLEQESNQNEDQICFYSPINVNGSGNIVNTNIQIYQPQQPQQNYPSQNVIFNEMNNQQQPSQPKYHQRIFSQPVSQCQSKVNSTEKIQHHHQQEKNIKVRGPFQQYMQQQNEVPTFQASNHYQQQVQPDMIILSSQQNNQHQAKRQHKRVQSIGGGPMIQDPSHHYSLIQPPHLQQPIFCMYGNNQGQPHMPVIHQRTPHNNQMNFGFGIQNQPQMNQWVQDPLIEWDCEAPQIRMQNARSSQELDFIQVIPHNIEPQPQGLVANPHYHARKRSMYVYPNPDFINANNQFQLQQQQQNLQNQMFHQRSQEVLLGGIEQEPHQNMMMMNRPNHRRATTNFIMHQMQPNLREDIRTLQPTMDMFFQPQQQNQIDQELEEDKQKLIAYIKHFTIQPIPELPITSVDYYKFVKLIGKGAFGKVTLGIHKLTGKQVAIKTVDKSLMKDDYQKKKVLQEVQILKKVRHGNVIRLLEVFESPKHLLMVMEYAGGGDLLQYVKKRKRLDEPEARRIFKQVVYGIAHCHCRSVLHRDIKLDNILLDNQGEIKICDFGVSRVISKIQRISEQCGTPAYIAPEIISDGGYQGFSADIWSLGVMLYAMLCGTVPFKAQSMHELHEIIVSGNFEYPSNVPLSQEAIDLINRLLVVNPRDRISISEILKHPWIQLYSSILNDDEEEYLPQNANCTSDITLHSFDANQIQNEHGTNGIGLLDSTLFQASNHINSNQLLSTVNVDNLYKECTANAVKKKQRLSFQDYCAITQDYATMHVNENVLEKMDKEMGMPIKVVKDALNRGELNHATATYQLMVMN